MTVFNGDSPMSLGVWLLTLFSVIAALYAIFWIPAVVRERIPVIGRWPLWSRAEGPRCAGSGGRSGGPAGFHLYRRAALRHVHSPLAEPGPAGPLLFLQHGHGVCGRALAGPSVLTRKAARDHRRTIPVAAGILSHSSAGLSSGASRLCPSVFCPCDMRPEEVIPLITGLERPDLVAGCGRGRHLASAVSRFEKSEGKSFNGFCCPRRSSGRGIPVAVGPGLYRPGACCR